MVVIEVKRRQHESIDEALRRFRRKVRKSGLMQQLRQRNSYEKPSDIRRRKRRLAERRQAEQADDEQRTSTPRQSS